jgi:type II secretory pathway component PulC
MSNLKMKLTLIFAIMVIVLTANAAVYAAEEQTTSQKSYDDYKVIYERNMFSKDRRPPQEEQQRRVRTTQVLAIYVLRGIAAQKNERVAFIEEQVSGQTMKAQVGTEVLNGRITEIGPDRVTFEENGLTRYISVGGEFGKTESTVMTTTTGEESQEAASTQTQPQTQQPAGTGSSGDEGDILRKLMERRQSELGR